MSFHFRPAIARGAELFDLPRPVPTLRVQESWHSEKFKVPLRDGDTLLGHSRNGVDITVQGQVGSQAGDLTLSEEAMLAALEALRAALHVSPTQDRYHFYVYYDSDTNTYRHFRNCSTTRFEWDLSDSHLFTYSATIHAEDPVLYLTGPDGEA